MSGEVREAAASRDQADRDQADRERTSRDQADRKQASRDQADRERVSSPAGPDFDGLEVGQMVASRVYAISRDSLVRYAGASGDYNPIHYRDDVAASVGLPGVLAHGMLTMGLAVQPVVDWAGDPARVEDYQVRFTRPVVVDPVSGAEISVSAKVGQLDSDARAARVDLTVTVAEQTVLAKAQVRVVLA